MWVMPTVGQRLKVSIKFWDAYLKHRRNREAPTWFSKCKKDGGWVLTDIQRARVSAKSQVVLCFKPGVRFQIIKDTGAFYNFEDGPPMFEPFNKTLSSMPSCPICGSSGSEMVNKFYCTNADCQNYDGREVL